jgi:cyclophilin family peptidyl-prolyl cis-trans isomerase
MPSDKRARQRAGREAKRLAEAKAARRRALIRNSVIVAVLAVVVIGSILLVTRHSSPPKSADKSTTTTTAKGTTTTTGASTTTTTTAATQNAAAQKAANAVAVAAGCPASTTATVNTMSWKSPPPMTITKTKTYTATVKTTAGTFTITLNAKTAPTTVNNFVFLAQKGFYKCNTFHRVVPGFMDQTGDPTGTGTGGPGYKIANENVPKAYATGELAMANSGGTDTNGSQFFILTSGGATTLNQDLSSGDAYSLFGKVTQGLTVVEKINSEGNASPSANGTPPDVTQRILSVTIHES